MGGELFDGYLPSIRSDELKSMVRMWGGSTQMRKAECIEYIREGLRDPERVRAAIAGLKPLERCALALAKQAGGTIGSRALTAALYASGWPRRRTWHGDRLDGTLVYDLTRRGLFVEKGSGQFGYSSTLYGRGRTLVSDPRLMEQIGFPQFSPLDISPVAAPLASTYRRSPSVVLDIMGVLQSIERIGGLGVTKAGHMRVGDLRKLERQVAKGGNAAQTEELELPGSTRAWVNALTHSNLLSFDKAVWRPITSLDQFALQPYSDQVRPVLFGFAETDEWSEWSALDGYSMRALSLFRWALIVVLAALPVDGDGFYSINDLGRALFGRVGEVLSFGYLPHAPYRGQKSAKEFRQEQAAWRGRLRQGWEDREQEWVFHALATWLYHLGVVELGLDERRKPISVRLTALGRAVLRPDLGPGAPEPSAASSAAWVIQPNFDVVAYLDRAGPEQLAFLERHAERVQAQQHTAHYRLTRNTVYGGLEGGSTLDEVLDTLRRGSDQGLAQNVETEIREWAALREKVVLYRRTRLLEFESTDARQEMMQTGVSGIPVGDRCLMLDADARVPARTTAVDYQRPLAKCITATEQGRLRVSWPLPDLIIAAQLDAWAERTRPDEWQLTVSSVKAATRAKRRVGELLDLLDRRSRRRIPLFLRLAVQAWAGKPPTVHMETVTVLKCPTSEVFEAIKKSARLQAYLRGVLAPDLLLVDSVQIDAFLAGLAWAGLEPIGRLPVTGD